MEGITNRGKGRTMRAPTGIAWLTGLALIFLGVTVSTAADIREGEWETTTEMAMEGVSFPLPPTKTTHCVTRQDPIPKGERDKNCTVKEQKVTGDTVRWHIVCTEGDTTSDGKGEMTYAGTGYKGTMLMTVTDKNGPPNRITLKMSGRYLGPCTGKSTLTTSEGKSGEAIGRRAAETQSPTAQQPQAETQGPTATQQPQTEKQPAAERTGTAADKAQEAIDSSVKSIRNIFKW